MKVIGIFNIKGGVGKTAAAVNLACLSAMDGVPTLLWDLDPQGAATFYFHKKHAKEGETKKILNGKVDLEDLTRKTDFENLRIIPSDMSYRHMDILLDGMKGSKKRIAELLETLDTKYERVFLDCPPSISLLSENIFRAAGFLLVPTIPTPLSLRTGELLREFLTAEEFDLGRTRLFYSMVDSRKKLHLETMETYHPDDFTVCRNTIPYLSEIEKMGVSQIPVVAASATSRGSLAWRRLWMELKKYDW
jgi:cellulose biosynthesis protein BcsQ